MAIHPDSMKNTFARHLMTWVVFLPLLSVIFIPMVTDNQNIDEAEVLMVQSFNIDLEQLTAKTNSIFSSAFITTGIMESTENFFSGKNPTTGQAPAPGMAAKWIRGVWLMIYKTIWRWHALWWIFFIPALALCVPAAVDGLSIRARKRYCFETSNPLFFYSSTHAVTMVLGLFFFLPVLPMTLSALILFGMLLVMATAVWIATANFQTGS